MSFPTGLRLPQAMLEARPYGDRGWFHLYQKSPDARIKVSAEFCQDFQTK